MTDPVRPMRPSRGRRAGQRGALVLMLGMTMLVAMALGLVVAHRSLLTEQRIAGQQQRAAQAFAAAEAGLDWAVAQLNSNRRVGADCAPDSSPTGASFRTQALRLEASTGRIAPVASAAASAASASAGTASDIRAICARDLGGWSCRCGHDGAAPRLAEPDAAAAFTIRFLAGDRPGVVRLLATGCDRLAGACDPTGTRPADATTRVEVGLALLSALPVVPIAAITTAGDVDAAGSPLNLRSDDPATGWLIDAGGRIDASPALLELPGGAAVGSALVDHDAALAKLSPERFFAGFFGAPPVAWALRPPTSRIACPPGDCGDTLESEVRSAAEAAVIRVDGDLSLAGPRSFGTPERPVLLVVSGAAHFDGAVVLHGVLHADALAWTHAAPGAGLHGALLAARRVDLDGAVTLSRDAATLQRLQRTTGSFVRIPGSWRDF